MFPLPSHTPNAREVNNLLHTLRGEQFRHSQNLQGSRAHVSSTIFRNLRSLPMNLTSPGYPAPVLALSKAADSQSSAYTNCPGPGPPKSWVLTSKEVTENTPEWRARAVSLVLPSPPPIPPLTTLCLRVLATLPTNAHEFTQDIAPYLLPHLRRDLIRYTAVHSPLPSTKLYALCAPNGNADTELIVVGPHASLPDNHFIYAKTSGANCENVSEEEPDESWDTDRDTSGDPLHTFVLMSTNLAASTLLSLPPTITRLALINLPTPISLHRLPGTCPLLVVLDLSYNTWLSRHSDNAEKILDRVEWGRWNDLHTIGLRECLIPVEFLRKLNGGRWDDVEVVQ